ncbi:MAG: hypothetical protein ACLTW9_05750 [Enterocloster sp.]
MVLAKESGYTVTPFDSTNIYTWEIGYKDKDGQERSILLSNFKDRKHGTPIRILHRKEFPDHDRRGICQGCNQPCYSRCLLAA